MQLEPMAEPRQAVVTPRRRAPFAVHAALAFIGAVVVVLLAAADAAAADDAGRLIQAVDEGVAPVVEPLAPVVQPIAPIVEPVLEPVAGQLGPVLEPVKPVIGAVLPVLEARDPLVATADLPVATPEFAVRAKRAATTAATPVGAPVATAASALPNLDARQVATTEVPRPVDGGSMAATVTRQLGDLFDSSVPLSGPPADAGTTMAAALLIGLLMTIASGWTMSANAARLRPIGLTLAPPVPPG